LLLVEFLKHLGPVDVVSDAYEAITRLDDHEPDVMVLDLLLPGATGVDLLERLREGGKSIPTVVVSGASAEDVLTSRARENGAVTVVAKPFDRRQLAFSVLEAARPNGD
jgi:CheY-like chemotaxis protein